MEIYMLSEEKIRIMTKLARFEEGPGQEALKIQGMYRSDYIGMSLIKNFFAVTIGYVLVLATLAVYHLDFLMEKLHHLNLGVLVAEIILGYVIVLVFYTAITYIVRSIQYAKAKRQIQGYDQELARLEKHYRMENIKNEVHQKERRK